MGRTDTLGPTATSVRVESGETIVRYHDTDVVRFNRERIILDSGGWHTTTTRARMNQASNQFNLGYRVWQERGQMFVAWWSEIDKKWVGKKEFFDSMILRREG